MFRRGVNILSRSIVFLAVMGSFALILSRLVTAIYARQRIYEWEDAPGSRVAIIFGAGLRRDGSPTLVLRDRVAVAAELYFAGKVEKLLMSGDNRFVDYNEPASMRSYALSLGVPPEAIVMDFAGRSTYETCYRAQAIFGVQDALLITQRFHLPRAIYLCNHLGMNGVGVSADRSRFRSSTRFFWQLRELPATLNALVQVHVTRPLPVLGQPEPIFPAQTQSQKRE